jgi:hypothetical protein
MQPIATIPMVLCHAGNGEGAPSLVYNPEQDERIYGLSPNRDVDHILVAVHDGVTGAEYTRGAARHYRNRDGSGERRFYIGGGASCAIELKNRREQIYVKAKIYGVSSEPLSFEDANERFVEMLKEEVYLSDLQVDGLLKEFLDRCGNGDQDSAFAAVDELRRRIFYGGPLPRDPRQTAADREAQKDLQRQWAKRLLAASNALMQCRDALAHVSVYLQRPDNDLASILSEVNDAAHAAHILLK